MAQHWWGRAVGGNDSEELVYPVLTVSGTPYDMGYQHGETVRQRVLLTVQTLRDAVGSHAFDAGWDAFQSTVKYCRSAVPELIAEMEGIADGARISFKDVWSINAHLDLFVWNRTVAGSDLTLQDLPGCSSHAVVAPDGSAWLGWNGDDLSAWMDTGVVVRGSPGDGRPPFVYFSWAGTIGRPGLNQALALGANSLPPCAGHRVHGLLYSMVCRKILQCGSAQEVVSTLERIQTCSAMNYMVVDHSGVAVDIETNGRDVRVLKPDNDRTYLLHTNHYLHPDHEQGNDKGSALCPRLQTAHTMYTQSQPQDVDSMFEVLSTEPIYQSPDRAGNDQRFETVVSMVAQLSDETSGEAALHVARGRAGDAPVVRVAVPSIAAPLPLSPASFAALSGPSLESKPASAATIAAAGITSEQQAQFERDGFLLLRGFYSPSEVETLRAEFHDMVACHDNRPKKVSYGMMTPKNGFDPDPFNPLNVEGMMDQTLVSDFWFDQFAEPRIVRAMSRLLGADLDFHNGKVRNKPPGYEAFQSWHQDWPCASPHHSKTAAQSSLVLFCSAVPRW